MNIVLYKNVSDKRCVTKDITAVVTLTGVLKEKTSVENPTIVIESDITTMMTFNYFYIPEFNRYYFLKEKPTVVRNTLFEISGRRDLLMSARTNILAQYAIVKKQAYENNTLLNDGSFKVYQNTKSKTLPFPNSFSGNGFVLTVAGG